MSIERILLIGSEGYIGRVLYSELQNLFNVDTCDAGWFRDPYCRKTRQAPTYRDYDHISQAAIQKYDAIILLAGHSSVAMCQDNLRSAFANNVQNFVNLLEKIGNIPLIYASSASVYGSGSAEKQFFEHDELPAARNVYDFTKQEIDRVALLARKNTYGLRFGTVNGNSPNLRTELMLNSMYLSAFNKGVVEVCNLKSNRAILWVEDLAKAIVSMLEYLYKNGTINTGIYNLASFNANIGSMAERVSKFMNCYVDYGEDSPTYSFQLNCQKFQDVFTWKPRGSVELVLEDLRRMDLSISEGARVMYTRNRRQPYAL